MLIWKKKKKEEEEDKFTKGVSSHLIMGGSVPPSIYRREDINMTLKRCNIDQPLI